MESKGDTKNIRDSMIEAWRCAGEDLHIQIQVPYLLRDEKQAIEFIAYIPYFGGINGAIIDMIVPPDYTRNKEASALVKSTGMFYTALSSEVYSMYERSLFTETLNDWGFWGPMTKKPEWIGQSHQ